MSYFAQFNYLAYPSFDDNTKEVLIKNFVARVGIKNSAELKNDKRIFYPYLIKEKETVDAISHKFYGTTNYYWTILILNNIYDINYDWPMDYQRFNDYIIDKYGSIAIAQGSYNYYIKPHEESTSFIQVTSDLYDLTTQYSNGVLMKYEESDYDEEVRLNELKRNINLIRKEHINLFVRTFEEAFN